MPHPFTAPPRLKPGDAVAVVAPSGGIDAAGFEHGVSLLHQRYDVRILPGIAAQHMGMAGRDERRAAELQNALDDPAVRAVFCACGGYGVTRILDRIDTAPLRRDPKWLVGYSDITALHARWALAGVQSVHGPNVMGLARLTAPEVSRYFETLESPTATRFNRLRVLRHGEATGPLLGGNLALLAALCGTDDFPPLDGAVLLLEDVNEKPYRVDRMLTQLRRAGVLRRVAGVALGRFSKSPPDDDGLTVERVLADRLTDLPGPVVAGLPIGHDGENLPVRLGAVVRIAGDKLECSAPEGD